RGFHVTGVQTCALPIYARKKGFLDGYKKYDAREGRGDAKQWQEAFSRRMGLDEARQTLGLPADAGWEAICQALRLAATESMARPTGRAPGRETRGRAVA